MTIHHEHTTYRYTDGTWYRYEEQHSAETCAGEVIDESRWVVMWQWAVPKEVRRKVQK